MAVWVVANLMVFRVPTAQSTANPSVPMATPRRTVISTTEPKFDSEIWSNDILHRFSWRATC